MGKKTRGFIPQNFCFTFVSDLYGQHLYFSHTSSLPMHYVRGVVNACVILTTFITQSVTVQVLYYIMSQNSSAGLFFFFFFFCLVCGSLETLLSYAHVMTASENKETERSTHIHTVYLANVYIFTPTLKCMPL